LEPTKTSSKVGEIFFEEKKRHGRPISEVGKLAVSLGVCAFCAIVFG